jgi:hypothetical protein
MTECVEDPSDGCCGCPGLSSEKLNSSIDVLFELPESRHALLLGGAVGLAARAAPSALVPRSDAAALSACKLASDLPDCSWSPAVFVPERLDDEYDAVRCGGSMVSTCPA